MLTLPLFMFQVFDRVLASRSEATLALLLLMATMALMVQAGLDAIRAFSFIRISRWIDGRVGPMLMSSIIVEALDRSKTPSTVPLRSLSTFRVFLTGPGMLTMLDIPWVPVFLFIIYWVNPAMGMAAIGGAVVMFILGLLNDIFTRKSLTEAQQKSAQAYQTADTTLRNAAVVEAMGMRGRAMMKWQIENAEVLELQAKASDNAAIFQAISKSMRMLVQMVIMAVAVLQIIDPNTAMTPGMMIATVLILGRALQPVEMGIAQARNLVEAIAAYRIVEEALKLAQSEKPQLSLPPPVGKLTVENVGYQPPGVPRPILQRVNFELAPGEGLGVIGPSAAGKSSLARLLVGVEKPTVGNVRIDGADAYSWSSEELGPFIGFMPQENELFDGTVAENISRLEMEPDPDAVVKAAKLTGLHDMILHLPEGYDTRVGVGGAVLSGGMRQRIALARALYGDPKILVLDEPNANLDASGDDALQDAINNIKASGTTIVMITHRPNSLASMDKVMILQNGVVQKFGPRDEVLSALPGSAPAQPQLNKPQARSEKKPEPTSDTGEKKPRPPAMSASDVKATALKVQTVKIGDEKPAKPGQRPDNPKQTVVFSDEEKKTTGEDAE